MARLGGPRRAHEHAWTHGAGCAQRRLRPGHPDAGDLRDDGAHGARDHRDDRPAPVAQPQLAAPHARRGRLVAPITVAPRPVYNRLPEVEGVFLYSLRIAATGSTR